MIEVEAILDGAHDLKAVNRITTPAEMQRMLDEHFFGLTTGSASEPEEDDVDDRTRTCTSSYQECSCFKS